ncbi:methyltransferase family protein [Bacteroidota bacterium]
MSIKEKTKEFIIENKSMLLNIYLIINLGGYAAWQTYNTWLEGNLDFVEISFGVQNVIMLLFILIRNKHKAIDKVSWHQVVALTAFFSGLLFIGQPVTGGEDAKLISKIVILSSNIFGAITLLNLGRSFGIMIALREVRTGGLYSFVRHPMYGTDILLRIGFIISHFSYVSIILFVISTGCYIYRAILEERFLKQDEEYKMYMLKVKYRFIPLVF